MVIDNKRIHPVRVSHDFSCSSDVDVVFICVKSQDTTRVAEMMKPYVKSSSMVISLQNGLRNTEMMQRVISAPILSGVVLFNAVCMEIGVVYRTMRGGVLIEYRKEYEDTLRHIVRLFRKAGLAVRLVDDIQSACMSKLVLNLQIAVTALTGQTIYESLKNKKSRRIIIETVKEGIMVAERAGIRMSRLPVIDPRRMIRVLTISGSFSLLFTRLFLKMKKNARNSMWQSLSKGRPTEIDYINGEIVALAEKNNITAPINMRLVELVKEAEREQKPPNFTPEELQRLLKI